VIRCDKHDVLLDARRMCSVCQLERCHKILDRLMAYTNVRDEAKGKLAEHVSRQKCGDSDPRN